MQEERKDIKEKRREEERQEARTEERMATEEQKATGRLRIAGSAGRWATSPGSARKVRLKEKEREEEEKDRATRAESLATSAGTAGKEERGCGS